MVFENPNFDNESHKSTQSDLASIKTLKFKGYLVPKILDGSKIITWRLFDDKDLQVGDMLLFTNSASGKEFAKAEIVGVREKNYVK